jgi:hypothetical protein
MLEDKRSHDEYGGIEYGGLPANVAVFPPKLRTQDAVATSWMVRKHGDSRASRRALSHLSCVLEQRL